MSTREKLLGALAIIFFVCVVVWVVRTTPSEPPPIEKVEPPKVMEYEGNTIVEEKDGQVIWELTCEKMRIDSITQNIELDAVTGKFYQYEKEQTWELKAAKGMYYQTEKNIHVEGDVIITNSDGGELLCDKLDWYSEQEILTALDNVSVTNSEGAKLLCNKLDWFIARDILAATGDVKISKDDMRAFGEFAYANNDFKHFGLMGNAKILKGVKDDETLGQ